MVEVGGIASEHLRSYIDRIERVEEEKAGLAADIRDIYAEAKGNGFDSRTMRRIVSLRKLDQSERNERDALLDLYRRARGMS